MRHFCIRLFVVWEGGLRNWIAYRLETFGGDVVGLDVVSDMSESSGDIRRKGQR